MIDKYLEELVERQGSDLVLTAGAPPSLRVDGVLQPVGEERLTAELTQRIAEELLTPEQLATFRRDLELDFSFGWRDRGRFRTNVFLQRGSFGLVLRLIPTRIPDMDWIGLPEAARRFADLPRGMVLVTGPTGSGKSTTVASLLEQINQTRACHIITIEDPIEYLHRHQKSIVEQRELHGDTQSFHRALRAALRENPDVVLVGEMRDLETIGSAITVAETGHLVFATLHTNDAAQTVDRIIDVFPTSQQQQVRVQLAATLQGVVSQLLLPRVGGGLVAAFEVLVANAAVRGQIREAATHQLRNTIMTGGNLGMQIMERSLVDLFRRGLITQEEMFRVSIHPEDLRAFLAADNQDRFGRTLRR
ncbi:MAG: type IV pilus twitching motility protein PilT [Thermaerobacter sp.]|nr:type IV pilus twitching motility protein PilT [Thermaerobacter sp.]